MKTQVAIVGAGISGLCCARELIEKEVECLVLEASGEVGGRVRTSVNDGFQLDHGFQVLLTAYPEARRVLDYRQLRLRSFHPGALVRHGGRFHRLADPFRRPFEALGGIFSPVGTLADKLRVGRLRTRLLRNRDERIREPETTTLEALRQEGFSLSIIERFFRPFLGGVFLDRDLETASSFFEFVFRMFSSGDIAVPAAGMGAIPARIASHLPAGCVRTHCRVTRLGQGSLALESGETVQAERIVLATEGVEKSRLLGIDSQRGWRSTACLYFSSPVAPVDGPWLVLNGEREGPANSLTVMTEVAPEYSQTGDALISVSVVGKPAANEEQLTGAVLKQMAGWFGEQTKSWRPLETFRIARALPAYPPGFRATEEGCPPSLVLCGDDLETPSLQGAMVSGRKAAQRVLAFS